MHTQRERGRETLSEQTIRSLFMGLHSDRLCTDRTHPAPLAFPNYTDLHISGFKCLQKEKLTLTDTW